MATIITDELKLLITAEAEAAIRELGSYKAALKELDAAHKEATSASGQTTSAMKDQSRSMKEAKAAISEAESEAKDLADSLSSVGDEAGKQADAVKDSSAAQNQAKKSSSSYASGLQQVDNAQSVVKVGAMAMGKAILGSLGPIAIVLKTVQLIKNLTIDANAAYAESEGEARKFSITYRDVAKDAEEAARSWAETFGYAESTAKSVLGSAGDMYTGMGMTGEAALSLADRTTYLGGALSKLNPQIGSAAEATRALITASTGEREALKTWGIIISEAAVQARLLERGQKDLTGAALLNARAQATLDIAYEQSPNALAAVTSATQLAADTNRELSEAWKEQMELAGQQANKVFQPIKKAIASYLKDLNEAKKAQLEAMEINPNIDLIEHYGKTADRVDELAEAYELLQEKSNLSKDEQADLKAIVAEIGTLVPSAVTAWDNYGQAIGASVTAAKEFADMQRELRIAEAEYQMLRLQYQQNVSKAEYETNKASLQNTERTLQRKSAEIGQMGKAYGVAKQLQILLKDQNVGYDSAIQYIKENASLLKDTVFSLEKVQGSSMPRDYINDQIDATIERYGRLYDEIENLNIEKAKYALGTKEYELYTAQIAQARAEIQFLTGDTEPLVKRLEDQIRVLPKVAADWRLIQKEYNSGSMSAELYVAEMRRLIDVANDAGKVDPTPDLTKWKAFIEGLGATSDISLADIEVELSPIIDPDGRRALLAEELEHYQGLINQLWQNRDAFDGLDEWKTALDGLVEKYDEVKDRSDAASFKDSLVTPEQKADTELEKTIARANELRSEGLLTEKEIAEVIRQAKEDHEKATGLTKDRQRAQELIASTLTEEQQAKQELIELEEELAGLKEKGLVTDEQGKAIIEARKEALADMLGEESEFVSFIKDSWSDIQENYFSLDAIGKLVSDTFADIGAALGSGGDALEASGKALQSFVGSLLSEISTMAIGAGLRMIVEGGWAGLPIALGLFALGGVAGIGGGFFGSSGAGLDASLSDTLSDELSIRESLNDALKEQLGIEETLLKRQLDRNLIDEDEYRESMTTINQEKNQSQAYVDALNLVDTKIGSIDAELSAMSGWTKFWTQDDEKLEREAERLASLATQIGSATSAEELRSLIAQLESFGIDTGSIPSFATGGSFVTKGRQLIEVGDNSSGRELVNIMPLGSAGMGTSGQTVVVNINGPVFDYQDLYKKLDEAGIQLQRRKMA